jgi:hypothetical protein
VSRLKRDRPILSAAPVCVAQVASEGSTVVPPPVLVPPLPLAPLAPLDEPPLPVVPVAPLPVALVPPTPGAALPTLYGPSVTVPVQPSTNENKLATQRKPGFD